MVGSKLRRAAHMDVRREAIQIAPEIILVVWWFEIDVAYVQCEIIFGNRRCDGREGLVKKSERLRDPVGFAAEQRLSHTFAGVQRYLLDGGD